MRVFTWNRYKWHLPETVTQKWQNLLHKISVNDYFRYVIEHAKTYTCSSDVAFQGTWHETRGKLLSFHISSPWFQTPYTEDLVTVSLKRRGFHEKGGWQKGEELSKKGGVWFFWMSWIKNWHIVEKGVSSPTFWNCPLFKSGVFPSKLRSSSPCYYHKNSYFLSLLFLTDDQSKTPTAFRWNLLV